MKDVFGTINIHKVNTTSNKQQLINTSISFDIKQNICNSSRNALKPAAILFLQCKVTCIAARWWRRLQNTVVLRLQNWTVPGTRGLLCDPGFCSELWTCSDQTQMPEVSILKKRDTMSDGQNKIFLHPQHFVFIVFHQPAEGRNTAVTRNSKRHYVCPQLADEHHCTEIRASDLSPIPNNMLKMLGGMSWTHGGIYFLNSWHPARLSLVSLFYRSLQT